MERVLQVAANVFNVPPSKLSLQTSPDNLPEWTSLKHLNLILALEQEFNLSFTQQDMIEMLNMELIAYIINEKLSG